MLHLFTLAGLLLPFTASAYAPEFFCREFEPGRKILLIEGLDPVRAPDGKPGKFRLELAEAKDGLDPLFAHDTAVGVQEEVTLRINVPGTDISVILFEDELFKTRLTLDGKTYRFECARVSQ